MEIKYRSFTFSWHVFIFKTSVFILAFLYSSHLHAQEIVLHAQQSFPLSIGRDVALLVNNKEDFDSTNVLQGGFKKSNTPVPIFSSPQNNIWVRFRIKDLSNYNGLYLSINYADISLLKLYEVNSSGQLHLINEGGNAYNFSNRQGNSINYNFILPLKKNEERYFYLNAISSHPYELPVYINTNETITLASLKENMIIGLYCGVIISTILYNLFLFFSTRDRNYLVYVIYLFALCFAQITLEGWSFKFFWPNFPQVNHYIVISTSCLASILAIVFAKYFLNTAYYSPRLDRLLSVLLTLYLGATILSFTRFSWISYLSFNYLGLIEAVFLLVTSMVVYKKGNSAALFYLIAWSLLLSGFFIYLLKNLSILPLNEFTHFVLYIGSAIEAVLLSFALANKINILRKEKELSQAEALRISQEKEKLIIDQNITLEKEVKQRTAELEKTLLHLKDTQVQLVESEKMSSLGQLTAGIAHEINNPINFVKSNVSPLQMDVKDLFQLITEYQQLHNTNDDELLSKLDGIKTLENKLDPDFLKEEIQSLIDGIEEGAERTAEIVRGLRIFSRLDESEMKDVNIYDNINSTLILLRNATPHYLKIRKCYEAPGEIECYPGKLNQVFMNILTNGIQAIKAKSVKNDEEYIDVSVTEEDEYMRIAISDTGIGMTEEVKHKVFDPFFTTKDVGEGTGLGMSIVFKIIEKHHGKINVISSPGNGAVFTIEIPYKLKTVAALAEEQAQLFEG